MTRLVLCELDDLHVHLRQGEAMDVLVPWLVRGGVRRVLVMVNRA